MPEVNRETCCDKPFWVGLWPSSEEGSVDQCVNCKQSIFYPAPGCTCQPWQYMPIPRLNFDGTCSHCGLFRDRNEDY